MFQITALFDDVVLRNVHGTATTVTTTTTTTTTVV